MALARAHPERNVVGVDIKGARIYQGATELRDGGVANGAFLRTGPSYVLQTWDVMIDFLGTIIGGCIVGGIGGDIRYMVCLPFAARLTIRQSVLGYHLNEEERFFHRMGNFVLGVVFLTIAVVVFVG